MMSIAQLLLLPATYLVYGALKKIYKWWKLRQFFHGVPGCKEYSFLLGNMGVFGREEDDRRMVYYEDAVKFSRLSRTWYGPLVPVISVQHPETIAEFLKAKSSKPPTDSTFYTWGLAMLRPYIGEGVILANGLKWKRNRKLITTYFNNRILRMSLPVLNEAVEVMQKQIAKFAEKKEAFQWLTLPKMCTLDALLQIAFSMKSNCQNVSVPYIEATKEVMRLIWKRMDNRLYGFNWIYDNTAEGKELYKNCKIIHEIAESIIEKKVETLKENPDLSQKKFLDLLDVLLTAKDDSGKGLTFEEVRNEVDTMFVAGTETTASSIGWTIYCLAKNPDCQSRAQAEVDSLLAGRDTDNVDWADLPELEYVGQCLNEAMRLFPPVPMTIRRLDEEFTIDGWTFPKGTNVNVNILGVGLNPAIWDNPLEFRPERFSSENKDKIPPLAFIPFGVGERLCLGRHVALAHGKIALARLIRSTNFKLDPSHLVKIRPQIITAAPNGVKLYAEKRSHGR